MKKLLATALVSLALVSCTKKPSCELTEKYSTIAGNGIGDVFQCKNKEQIAKDIQSKIEDLKMCEKPSQTGPIAAIVCKPVAAYVTSLVVHNTLPKKWECSGGVPATGLEAFIYSSCSSLPF